MHVQDFMENNGEAILHDVINTGRENDEGDYTQAEANPETGQHVYDIGTEPLFPTTSTSTEEGMTVVALAESLASCIAADKRINQRTESYMPAEDRVLCQAWLEISTDPICGAEKKGSNYWMKVRKFFHEQRKVCGKPFQSDRSDLSLSKR
jgi:hypothetical protein